MPVVLPVFRNALSRPGGIQFVPGQPELVGLPKGLLLGEFPPALESVIIPKIRARLYDGRYIEYTDRDGVRFGLRYTGDGRSNVKWIKYRVEVEYETVTIQYVNGTETKEVPILYRYFLDQDLPALPAIPDSQVDTTETFGGTDAHTTLSLASAEAGFFEFDVPDFQALGVQLDKYTEAEQAITLRLEDESAYGRPLTISAGAQSRNFYHILDAITLRGSRADFSGRYYTRCQYIYLRGNVFLAGFSPPPAYLALPTTLSSLKPSINTPPAFRPYVEAAVRVPTRMRIVRDEDMSIRAYLVNVATGAVSFYASMVNQGNVPLVLRAALGRSAFELTNVVRISAITDPDVWAREVPRDQMNIDLTLPAVLPRFAPETDFINAYIKVDADIQEQQAGFINAVSPLLSYPFLSDLAEVNGVPNAILPLLAADSTWAVSDLYDGVTSRINAGLPALKATVTAVRKDEELHADTGGVELADGGMYLDLAPGNQRQNFKIGVVFGASIEFDDDIMWEPVNSPNATLRLGFSAAVEVDHVELAVNTGVLGVAQLGAVKAPWTYRNHELAHVLHSSTNAAWAYTASLGDIFHVSGGQFTHTPWGPNQSEDTDPRFRFLTALAPLSRYEDSPIRGNGWGDVESLDPPLGMYVEFGSSNFGTTVRKNLDSLWVTATVLEPHCSGDRPDIGTVTLEVDSNPNGSYDYPLVTYGDNHRAVAGRGLSGVYWSVSMRFTSDSTVTVYDVQFSTADGDKRRALGRGTPACRVDPSSPV